MKTAIRFFTKSKKGNTVKLANFISAKTNLPALDVTNNLEEEVDQLILVNAMYAADVDVEVKDFLTANSDKIKCLINVNSSASGRSTYKAVKKVCDKVGIKMSDKEFHTAASWLFINKGRPNEADFNCLAEFIKGLDI